jgi:hypothetical protein
MKMKKSLVALCLTAGCWLRAGCQLRRCQFRSAKHHAAPAIPAPLQQLNWTPSINQNPNHRAGTVANPECSGYYRPGCRLQRTR